MEKCVCCGKELPEKPYKAKVQTRSFDVCSQSCQEETGDYLKRDKRFKTLLYLLVFAGGCGFVISAVLGGDGPLKMLPAYIGQLLAGLAFFFFPYPIISFESFHRMSIRGVTRLTRIVGIFFAVTAVIWLVLLFL